MNEHLWQRLFVALARLFCLSRRTSQKSVKFHLATKQLYANQNLIQCSSLVTTCVNAGTVEPPFATSSQSFQAKLL